MVWLLWKIAWLFLKKLKIELPSDSALMSIFPEKIEKAGSEWDICTSMFMTALLTTAKRCNSSVHHRMMGKQNVVWTDSRILLTLKMERNSDTYDNMVEPWGHYAKWDKPLRSSQEADLQKTKIMDPAPSLHANRWGNNGNTERLYCWGLQNHCRWWLQPWN